LGGSSSSFHAPLRPSGPHLAEGDLVRPAMRSRETQPRRWLRHIADGSDPALEFLLPSSRPGICHYVKMIVMRR
jgi:hypothetical protein